MVENKKLIISVCLVLIIGILIGLVGADLFGRTNKTPDLTAQQIDDWKATTPTNYEEKSRICEYKDSKTQVCAVNVEFSDGKQMCFSFEIPMRCTTDCYNSAYKTAFEIAIQNRLDGINTGYSGNCKYKESLE